MGCSLPGSSVYRILQARILECVAISFSGGSSGPKDQTHVSCISCIGRQILYHCAAWETTVNLYINYSSIKSGGGGEENAKDPTKTKQNK